MGRRINAIVMEPRSWVQSEVVRDNFARDRPTNRVAKKKLNLRRAGDRPEKKDRFGGKKPRVERDQTRKENNQTNRQSNNQAPAKQPAPTPQQPPKQQKAPQPQQPAQPSNQQKPAQTPQPQQQKTPRITPAQLQPPKITPRANIVDRVRPNTPPPATSNRPISIKDRIKPV